MGPRLDAIQALKSYGEALEKLVTSQQAEEIKKAVDSMLGSFEKVDGISFTANQKAGISTAIQAIGGLLVESMRKKAVRKVVDEVGPSIRVLTEALREDYDRNMDALAKAHKFTTKNVRDRAGALVKSDDLLVRSLAYDMQARAEAADARWAVVAQKLLKARTGALDGLVAAHAAVQKALRNDRVSVEDVKTYLERLDDLRKAYELLTSDD